VAGSAFSWLESNLGIVDSVAEVAKLAATVENSGDVVFVPAFAGLFAPYWRLVGYLKI
jgi:glycerol kinase